MSQVKIVVLDGKYANPGDLSWDKLKNYGEVTIFDQTPESLLIERAKEASIIITNKVEIRKKDVDQLPQLKLIVISATGMNNVDLEEADRKGIIVKNITGYSTNSVSQHTWSLILELTNRVALHDENVKKGNWNEEKGFSYTVSSIPELAGKNLGVYGLGEIGKKVAEIGIAFGMNILVSSNHAKSEDYPDFKIIDIEELFAQSDVLSLHAPLRQNNHHIVNEKLLRRMKSNAILINTARGPLVDEQALFEALKSKQIGGAALDVLESEPPGQTHKLFELDNCIITPHMAWTTKASRSTLINGVIQHVADFINP